MNKQEILNESTQKKWLDFLKEQSWEAELLISTVAIYGTFQLFSLVDWHINLLINQFPEAQYLFGYFLGAFVAFAVGILAACFVVHFIIRAYWVGLVGLNSVYADYDFESSAYSEIYTELMVNYLPRLSTTIDKVDRIASVIFSIAISFFFMFIWGAMISTLILLLYNNFIIEYLPALASTVLGYFVLAIFFILMLFSVLANISKFKKLPWLQKLYFNVTKWANKILLGPLFMPIMQVFMIFGTNFKRDKKLMISLLVGVFIINFPILLFFFGSTNLIHLADLGFGNKSNLEYRDARHWQFYANKNERTSFLVAPEIQTDLLKNEALSLFIPIMKHERRNMMDYCPTFSKKDDEEEARSAYLACYRHYHEVWLNENQLELSFLKYDHERTLQFGIQTFISPKLFHEGSNILTIKKMKTDAVYKEWQIPFFVIK